MKFNLNLASQRYINQQLCRQVILLILVLLFVLGAYQLRQYLQGTQRLQIMQSSLDEMEQQLMALQGVQPQVLTEAQLASQRQEYAQAQALLQRDAFRWTALFDRMERQLPAGVSIRSFNPDYEKKELVLSGVARRLDDLRRLLDNLHEESFRQVYLERQSWTEVSDGAGGKRPALSFSIRLEGIF